MTLPAGYALLRTKKVDKPKKAATVKELKAQADKLKPISPPTGYVLQPYTPTALDQLRNSVANSAIGYSIEQTMPALADALNLHPSETVNSPNYAQDKTQLISPQYLTDTAMKVAGSVIPDAERKEFDTKANRDRVEGALTATGNLTSGKNLALLGGTTVAAGLTAGVVNPATVGVLSRLVSGGFTLDMLHGLYQQNKEYRKAVDAGDLETAHKIQGEMGVTGVMALLTGKHALTKHKFTPVTEPVSRERTNVLHRNGAGEVRQAKGEAPTVWLSPDAWHSLMTELYPEENPAETHGFNLPASDDLLQFATQHQPATPNPAFSDVQALLAKAHENASEGGLAIGKKRGSIQDNVRVMREELNHTWQRGLANGNVNQHLDPQQFTNLYQAIPSGMYDHLLEHGYDGRNTPEIVAEAAAKLMDGRPERFGVDEDDAVDFLDRYFKAVTDKHGAKALEELHHVRGIAADAKARAIEEHGRTRAGQDNNAVSGVAGGGQGGNAEGVQAEGEPVTSTRNQALGIDEPHTIPVAMKDGTPFTLQRWFGGKYKIVGSNGENIGTIGYLRYPDGGWKVSGVDVAPEFRRKGVATAAYNALEKVVGAEFQDTGSQTEQGRLFWEGRDKQKQAGQDTPLFNREKDKPIWYLKSEKLIGEKMRGPMPGQDVSKMLIAGGVKPEEMHWTGLDDFLKSKGKEKVTPEEIREHLANNNIQIKEVTKGGIDHTAADAAHAAFDRGEITREERNRQIDAAHKVEQGAVKYGSYVLPGGESYREMLLTMPEIKQSKEYRDLYSRDVALLKEDNTLAQWNGKDYSLTPEAKNRRTQIENERKDIAKQLKSLDRGDQNFRSGHWKEPNILAHVRFNDRTGPNGEKLLHVEEVQSDMMQSMRKQREAIAQHLSGEGFYDIIKKMQDDGTIEVEC
ncbi:unnamed protein product [Sphagnum jensenii]